MTEVRIRGESGATTCSLSQLMSLGANVQADYFNANLAPLLLIGNKDPRSKRDPYHRLLQLTTCCAPSFPLGVMQSFRQTLNHYLLANAKRQNNGSRAAIYFGCPVFDTQTTVTFDL